MSMRLFRLVVLALIAVVQQSAAVADTKTVLRYSLHNQSGAWVPYMNVGDPVRPGILVELARLILAEARIAGKEISQPKVRAAIAFERKLVDFEWSSPAWFQNNKFPQGSVGTIDILLLREVLIYPPGEAGNWPNVAAIQGQLVGTVLGYTYHDEILFDRYDVRSEQILFRMVAKGRLKVGIMAEHTARYWAREEGLQIGLGPPHSVGGLKLRLRAEFTPLLPRLNAAIERLNRDGAVEWILERYLGKNAAQRRGLLKD